MRHTSRPAWIATGAAQPVPEGFCYNSGSNPDFLSVAQLRELIVAHVDPAFAV